MDGFDSAADELYAGDPSTFTTRRDAAVADARAVGDRPLAAAIARLRRPTLSAWSVNLLSRHAADELAALLELADALAAAQESLSGPDLRRLSAERNRVVQALAGRAAALAADRGTRTSPGVRDEVVSTLQAALADPQVRALVRQGRLDRARSYSGFGPGEGAAVVGGTASARNAAPGPRSDADDGPGRATLMRARTRVVDAESALAAAEQQERVAAETESAAWEQADRAGQEVADLRDELAAAERALAEARASAEAGGHAHDETRAAVSERQRDLDRARADLAAVEQPPSR